MISNAKAAHAGFSSTFVFHMLISTLGTGLIYVLLWNLGRNELHAIIGLFVLHFYLIYWGIQRSAELKRPSMGHWELDLRNLNSFLEHVYPEDRILFRHALNQSMLSGIINHEFRVVWKDNSVRWLALSGQVSERRILGLTYDITDKKEFQKSAKEIQFYREEFIPMLSHELRTPLTSLKLQTQIFKRALAKENRDDQFSQRLGRQIEVTDKQVSRLVLLVNEILEMPGINYKNVTKESTYPHLDK